MKKINRGTAYLMPFFAKREKNQFGYCIFRFFRVSYRKQSEVVYMNPINVKTGFEHKYHERRCSIGASFLYLKLTVGHFFMREEREIVL